MIGGALGPLFITGGYLAGTALAPKKLISALNLASYRQKWIQIRLTNDITTSVSCAVAELSCHPSSVPFRALVLAMLGSVPGRPRPFGT